MSVSWMAQKCLIIFAIVAAFAILPIHGLNAKAMVILNMAETILTASADPVRSAKCFAIYQPHLTAITNAYERQHDSCLNAAQNAKVIVNNEVESSITSVQQISTNICSSFSTCTQDRSDNYNFFDCNNKAASTTVPLSHNIKNISKDKMQYIAMRTDVITFDLNSCTDKCSQEYIAEHSKVFGELKYCLDDKDSVGTTVTTTISPRTAATSSVGYPTPPTIIDD